MARPYETAKQYFEAMVDASATGELPATSSESENKCTYRSGHGTSCVAGMLIPDDEYDPAFEGNGLSMDMMPIERYSSYGYDRLVAAVKQNLPDGVSYADVVRLQHLHDNLSKKWNHDEFVAGLLAFPCFADLKA